jgi:hypothetical protein
MRQCPKCSSKYSDDLNFCLNCDAMLESFLEAPQPVAKEASLPKEIETPKPASIPNTSKDASADKNASLPPIDQAKRPAVPKPPGRQCSKCGSTKIIPNAWIPSVGRGSDGRLRVAVDAKPDALIFKERQYAVLLADICGDCGHVELRVQDYRSLYNHYLQSKNN